MNKVWMVIRFGKWDHKATSMFCYDRLYRNGYKWTPFCLKTVRFVGLVETDGKNLKYTTWSATCGERMARWEKSNTPCEGWKCSACGGGAWYYDYNGAVSRSKYCPNCGAKMEGEEDAEIR